MSENLQVSRENEELRGMVGELQKKLEEKEKKEKEQEHNLDNNQYMETVKDGAADVNVDLVNVAHIDTKVMDELRSQLSTETARRVACETTMGELMRTVKKMEEEKAITAHTTAQAAQQQAQQQAEEQARKKALHSQQNQQQPTGNDKNDTNAAAAAVAAAEAKSLAEAEARALEMQQLLSSHQQQVASINTTHSLQLSEMQEANVLRVAEMMAQVLTQRTA